MLETIGICIVFVFSLRKILEKHWNMCDVCVCAMKKPGKPLDFVGTPVYNGSNVCSIAKSMPKACIVTIRQDQCLCDIKDAWPPFAR